MKQTLRYKIVVYATTVTDEFTWRPQWSIVGTKEDGKHEYGYPPVPMDAGTQESTDTVYEQTVNVLDLRAVINAVNSQTPPPADVPYDNRPNKPTHSIGERHIA